MEEFVFQVNIEDAAKRLDVYLTKVLEGFSRNSIQIMITQGDILVNETRQKANYKLKKDDTIFVLVRELELIEISAENIPLDILYEDQELIVINKPQGMVVHPSPGHFSGTLVNALLYHCGEQLSGINGVMRPGIIHRIDKDTSGILVVAKTNNAHQFLSIQLSNHSMKREYYALVYNNLKNDQGTINKPVGRNPIERKKMCVNEKNGKKAVTHYYVIQRLGNYNLIKAVLETGRTHQIRVHLASIGHPLLGDTVYGKEKCPFKLSGQALHARFLGFVHPTTKEYMEFQCRLPDYFEKLLEKLKV